MMLALALESLARMAVLSPATYSPNFQSRAAISGCGKSHAPGFYDVSIARTFISGTYNRSYAIEIPPGYKDLASTHWPLIVDYHGRYGTPKRQRDNSRYFDHAMGQEYLVVYPEGLKRVRGIRHGSCCAIQ